MCGWGDGSAGKILSSTDKLYAREYKIKILDEKNRDKIVKFFNEFDWNGFTNGIAMKRETQLMNLSFLSFIFLFLYLFLMRYKTDMPRQVAHLLR